MNTPSMDSGILGYKDPSKGSFYARAAISIWDSGSWILSASLGCAESTPPLDALYLTQMKVSMVNSH